MTETNNDSKQGDIIFMGSTHVCPDKKGNSGNRSRSMGSSFDTTMCDCDRFANGAHHEENTVKLKHCRKRYAASSTYSHFVFQGKVDVA